MVEAAVGGDLKVTQITKLVMDGFKSFGKRTEMLFEPGFNVVLGPNGSGKSCSPDTEVLLGDGSVVKIGSLVEKELQKAGQLAYLDDGVYCANNHSKSVFTLNPETMQIEQRPVAAFVRREGEPYLYKLTTSTGKSVVTTGCHPVMVFKNGCVQSEVVENLSSGNLIAAPRHIPLQGAPVALPCPEEIESACTHDKNITFPAQTSSAFGRWLGLTLGDGYIRYDCVEFINADEHLVKEWISLAKDIFNFSHPYLRKTGISYRVIYHSRKLPAFLAQLLNAFGRTSITSEVKIIPPQFLKADLPAAAALISGLIDTDGYVSRTTPTLEYTSKNEKLVDQVQLLLLRLGIVSRKKLAWKHATNTAAKTRRKYATLIVEGKERLEKFTAIPITRNIKRQRLYFWAARDIVPNPNLDVLPEESNLLVKQVTHLLRMPVKKLRKSYPRLAAYVENRCRPSRDGINKVVSLAEKRWHELAGALQALKPDQKQLIQALRLSRIPMSKASSAIGLHPTIIGRDWAAERFCARQENLEHLHVYLKEELATRLDKAGQLLSVLKALCSSDILWEQIKSIEQVQGTPYVYDLCIIDNHNFIANNIFVHNSNVLDALCFVLGKSSSKALRAEKSANLIYNGGKTKKPSNTAEVSIFFDNKKRIFPVDDDTLKISRIVRHDGASKYKINGKTMTRQEVVDMLAMAKIYPDGYNIILQGDIVRLVEMSTIERRQIIEEIAGISVYEEKKQKALNELQKVEEKLNEAEIILKERETYLKELKKDRDHALKYKNLSDNIKKNKASYLKRQMVKKDDEKTVLEEKSGKIKLRFDAIKSQITKLREEIAQRKEQIKQISDEIEQKGEVEQIKLQKEVEKLRIDVATKKTRTSSCHNEISRIAQRKEQLKANIDELDNRVNNLKAQKEELSGKVNFFQKEIAGLDKRISDFKKKHKLGEGTEFEQKLEKIDKDSEELQKQIQALREQQQNFLREKDKCEFQIATIDQQIEKVLELEKEHKQEIELLKKKKEQFKKLVLELNDVLNADSKHAIDLSNAKSRALKVKEELEKLKVKNAGIKESLSANIAVKKVLESKSKLGEIYGTIAELGIADEKYSLALEVAAANKIQSIVVEDDKTAATCIKFLKQNKYGVATFLPLNKIRAVNKDKKIEGIAKQKGVIGFAIDLIEFDPKFKDAFSHVFGNTLVVEDIDMARKIGIGVARMVTLDGDLAETSGAMVGGFRHKKDIGFRQKDLSEDIKEKEKDVREAEKHSLSLEKLREENEKKIYSLRELKANLEGDIIKTEKSLHIDSSDLDATKAYKEDLRQNIEKTGKELAKTEDRIVELTQELTKLKIEKQSLRDQITELRNPRLIAELNAFEQKKKEYSDELIKATAEMKNLDVQEKEIAGRDKENTSKIMKELEKEENNFKQEIKDLDGQVKAQESELKKKDDEQQKFFLQFKSLFEKRNKVSDEITVHESRILTLEEGSRKEELGMNTLSIEEARVKAELAGMNAEFAQYDGIELDMEKPEEKLKKEISDFEKMMADFGSVNMKALEIYETVEKEYGILVEKKSGLSKEKDDVVKLMDEIELSKKGLFIKTLDVVNENFRKIFTALSTKGDAYLELENLEKPFDEGLRIKVKLTGMKFLDIRGLSGGEKTMTALAFLFAIQEHEPASFYVLDEVDAALDKANSDKLAKLIRDYCKNAQYIVISHNDALITEADTLYGVSMQPEVGISNVVSLKA